MKKFAAVLVSSLLATATAFSTVASAATVLEKDEGSITLWKYEQTEDRDKLDDSKPVTGAVFTAYKVAELTSDGLYTVVEAYKDASATVDGKAYTLDNLLSTDKYTDGGSLTYTSTDIAEALIPSLQALASDGTDFTEIGNGEYKADSLGLGVYLIVETTVPTDYVVASQSFLVSVPEWDEDTSAWNYDITAYPKDSPVNPTKLIDQNDDGTGDVDKDNAEIGDTVDYVVTANLPYYGTALPTSWTEATDLYPTEEKFNTTVAGIDYKFTDTMSKGLTYNEDMVITIGGTTLTKDTDYTITSSTDGTSGDTTITVTFYWSKINQYQGKEIKFDYSAVLNEDAVIGSTGNDNTVKITYDNNPQTEDDDVDTTPDTTTVYTYGFDLTKKFNNAVADGTTIDASGVTFSLKDSDGTTTMTFAKIADGQYVVYSKDMGADFTTTTTISPTSKGALSVDGLDEGTYTLTEESSITNYSKLASDVTIVVSDVKTDGELTGKVSATIGDETLDTDGDGTFEFEINNVSKQFDLPLTGGTGILLFTIGGGLVIAAGVIIFAQIRKRRSAK